MQDSLINIDTKPTLSNNTPLYRRIVSHALLAWEIVWAIILVIVFSSTTVLYAESQQPAENHPVKAEVITSAPWQVVPPLTAEITTLAEKGFKSSQELFNNINQASGIHSISISPDGKSIISGSNDGIIKHWSVETGKLLQTFNGHKAFVSSVAISPDGKSIVSGSWDKTVKRWSLETGQLLQTFKGHTDYVTSVAISPDGKSIVSGSWDKAVKRWS